MDSFRSTSAATGVDGTGGSDGGASTGRVLGAGFRVAIGGGCFACLWKSCIPRRGSGSDIAAACASLNIRTITKLPEVLLSAIVALVCVITSSMSEFARRFSQRSRDCTSAMDCVANITVVDAASVV